ncbi:hypothetical protein RISK_002836 [Rhodopirellula islandica]|uniref:Uncharacterized protein n=1 Tax=Rhodopirellula islandica TaxID=595434 RepID=A0A0J1EHP9_RHOIS|nr:hypothetical protein RISK_002836 [Rhodopirellula islandica]
MFIMTLAVMPVSGLSQDSGFGKRQVKQMLADRPDMKNVIGREHPICAWVVDGLEENSSGSV